MPEFREPDYNSFEDSKKILAVLRKLHKADITADYGMKPWEDALDMEKLLEKKDPVCFVQYEGLKNSIGQLYKMTLGDGVKKCFCHGDTYKPNWMIRPDGSVILIDWEYSGYSDPGIDVGYYVVDAMYDFDKAEEFIKEYLRKIIMRQQDFIIWHMLLLLRTTGLYGLCTGNHVVQIWERHWKTGETWQLNMLNTF
ncbi:phosphotransferase family protein [Lachnospira eligens]|uniref:phosphotransferase family protein n=1 Tax=Lachnospira eligens TaxID=39485 RepID=UPI002E8E1072|nr:phosphotransferase [Lachnospira eligens]